MNIDILSNIISNSFSQKNYILIDQICNTSKSVQKIILHYIEKYDKNELLINIIQNNLKCLFKLFLNTKIINENTIINNIPLPIYLIKENSNDIFKLWISNGLSPDLKYYNYAPSPRISTNIIKEKTYNGYSLLYFATLFNNINIVKLLLNKVNIDVYNGNKRERYPTALSVAAINNNQNITRLLLKNNANPNISDSDNFTLLYRCIDNECNLDIIQLLLEYDADPYIKDNDIGDNAINLAYNNNFPAFELIKNFHNVEDYENNSENDEGYDYNDYNQTDDENDYNQTDDENDYY